MCGIVGYIGSADALTIAVSGLEKLEYRGYDSAGVAILNKGTLEITRALGKLSELKKQLVEKYGPDALSGKLEIPIGIGHTRWATHGKPSENNAHPHTCGRVSLVHNGIIENYLELREKLEEQGCEFRSETDTEIAAHLLNQHLETSESPLAALRAACGEIRGSYAFLAMDSQHPDLLLIAKSATPIIIGVGEGEVCVASDIPAVLGRTRKIIVLEDGDIAEVRVDKVTIENGGMPVTRRIETVTWDPVTAQKGGYKHYMLKEIYEQDQAIADTLRGRIELEESRVTFPELSLTSDELKHVQRIILVACGTAWHACLTAKFYLENFAKIPCDVDYASEFRYRNPVLDKNTLVIAVSQSGETADTLAAIELAGSRAKTMAICNVLGSSMARKVPNVIFTHAGPEISVASTKAFTTQLVALYLMALYFGQERGRLGEEEIRAYTSSLIHIPAALSSALKSARQIEKIAKTFYQARDFLYLGRGICYPIALEGALKLKELSYIHAEGYPAGEMKHGPIALIDENMPVVVLLQKSIDLVEKILSNLKEVESRGGRLIVVTDLAASEQPKGLNAQIIEIPHVSPSLAPLLFSVPMQLLAYYMAVFNGTDVDLPRNLAKSVTVE